MQEETNTPLPSEEWRPVSGYEGLYAVSSYGRVRSLPRSVRAVSFHTVAGIRQRRTWRHVTDGMGEIGR